MPCKGSVPRGVFSVRPAPFSAGTSAGETDYARSQPAPACATAASETRCTWLERADRYLNPNGTYSPSKKRISLMDTPTDIEASSGLPGRAGKRKGCSLKAGPRAAGRIVPPTQAAPEELPDARPALSDDIGSEVQTNAEKTSVRQIAKRSIQPSRIKTVQLIRTPAWARSAAAQRRFMCGRQHLARIRRCLQARPNRLQSKKKAGAGSPRCIGHCAGLNPSIWNSRSIAVSHEYFPQPICG